MHHIKTTKMAATMLVLKVVGSRKKRNSFAYNIYNFLDDLVLCDLLLFVQIFLPSTWKAMRNLVSSSWGLFTFYPRLRPCVITWKS